MAGITLAQAEAKLSAWLDAETALQTSQEYTIGRRTVRKADLKEIRETINFWERKVIQLTKAATGGGSIRITGGTPL